MSKKILFLALHRPNRSPSQRYRFDQFMPYLQTQGWDIDYSYLIEEQDDAVFYGAGNYLGKFRILAKSLWKRWREISKAKQYDLVVVQREALMLGTAYFEKKIAKKVPLIFDFDDAIWQPVVSEGNKKLAFLKDAKKTEKLIACANEIWAGNQYLSDFAQQFNSNVRIVPTVVDTDEYTRVIQPKGDKICIGWSGSFSTVPHFEHAIPALKIIQEKYPEKVYFKLIGDANYKNESLHLQGIGWSKATEIKELSEIDIGIMPLPDDEWTKGKCGLKALVYMSMEIPTIVSPVGVNTEIVQHRLNGLWASTTEEWVEQLSQLIENQELRHNLGKAGRAMVLEKYSVLAWRDRYIDYFEQLTQKKSIT